MIELNDRNEWIIVFTAISQINESNFIIMIIIENVPAIYREKDKNAEMFSSCLAACIIALSGNGTRSELIINHDVTAMPSSNVVIIGCNDC